MSKLPEATIRKIHSAVKILHITRKDAQALVKEFDDKNYKGVHVSDKKAKKSVLAGLKTMKGIKGLPSDIQNDIKNFERRTQLAFDLSSEIRTACRVYFSLSGEVAEFLLKKAGL